MQHRVHPTMPTAAPLQALCVRAFARRLPALPTGARALLYADGASARALAACAGLQGLASALRLSAASLAVLDLATARATDAPWSPLDGAADEAPCFHGACSCEQAHTRAHARTRPPCPAQRPAKRPALPARTLCGTSG